MKKVLGILLAMMLMISLFSCAFAEEDDLLIYMVAVPGSPYYSQCERGMQAAAKELGGNIEAVLVGGATLDAIRESFEKCIGADPDGILVLGLTYELMNEPIITATEKDIAVFLFDSYVAGTQAKAYYGTDNLKAGQIAAEDMAKRLNGTGKIACISQTLDTESSQGLRRVGFINYMEENYPDIEIVAIEQAIDLNVGAEKASQLLNAYPDLAGIFCSDGQTPKGVASIIEERELAGKIVLECFDEDEQILNEIIKGNITATIMQDAYGMAHDCVVAMVDYIRNGTEPAQEINYLDCFVIDQTNGAERLEAFLASGVAG